MSAIFRWLVAALLVGLTLTTVARAADVWPNHPLKLIVPFPPGGAADVVGRYYAEQLAKSLGQPVVVENKPGAGTAIAAEAAAKAAPDGYTLSLAPTGQLATLPHLAKTLRFDPLKDFAPVSLLASVSYVVATNGTLPVNNLQELAAYARANPGKVTYSSCGNGTLCHLAGELFANLTGSQLLHVLAPQVRAGKVKGLALTSAQRSPVLPQLPTTAEAGLPKFEVSSWFGLVVPVATPAPIVARLAKELAVIAALPETHARLAEQGLSVESNTPEAFAALIRRDSAKWAEVIRAAGVVIED